MSLVGKESQSSRNRGGTRCCAATPSRPRFKLIDECEGASRVEAGACSTIHGVVVVEQVPR